MKKVYVLMYWSDEDGLMDVNTGETTPPKLKPYAVFEDKFTAEKMKRERDEIFEVPYFREDFPNTLRITEDDLKGMPLNIPCETHITYQRPEHHSDSTLAPFPPPNYPKVTCNKTVDEHTWANRID